MKSKTEKTIQISELKNLPRHIAFIMDGNGRWAKKRLMPRSAGHKKGVEVLKKIVAASFDTGIECVSVYAFSTENQKRSAEERSVLISLIEDNLKTMLGDFIKNEIRICFMGDTSYFSANLQTILSNAVEKSRHFTKKIFNIALNYGSQQEIVRAVNTAVEKGERVDTESFSKYLYTADLPPLDLVVRTSGEYRLSNFMLYQSAYSELCFTKTLWPDFNKNELYKVLEDYSSRERRFGKA